jgi:TRAP-type C4-dicarboxylate transport system permease small subunit
MTALRHAMVWLGGLALLAMTAIDTLAVIGRHTGFPVHGSIELIQAAVLVAGALAMVAATLADNHARVHLLLDRLSPGRRHVIERLCHLGSVLFFGALLIGSAWIAFDLWNGHEQSELVGVPWRWLRLFANLCFAALVILSIRAVFLRKRP